MHRTALDDSRGAYAAITASLTLEDLPPAETTRWVSRRKAQVVAAVRSGLLSMEEARIRYALSEEEFRSWQVAFDRYGLEGLRVRGAPGHERQAHGPRPS